MNRTLNRKLSQLILSLCLLWGVTGLAASTASLAADDKASELFQQRPQTHFMLWLKPQQLLPLSAITDEPGKALIERKINQLTSTLGLNLLNSDKVLFLLENEQRGVFFARIQYNPLRVLEKIETLSFMMQSHYEHQEFTWGELFTINTPTGFPLGFALLNENLIVSGNSDLIISLSDDFGFVEAILTEKSELGLINNLKLVELPPLEEINPALTIVPPEIEQAFRQSEYLRLSFDNTELEYSVLLSDQSAASKVADYLSPLLEQMKNYLLLYRLSLLGMISDPEISQLAREVDELLTPLLKDLSIKIQDQRVIISGNAEKPIISELSDKLFSRLTETEIQIFFTSFSDNFVSGFKQGACNHNREAIYQSVQQLMVDNPNIDPESISITLLLENEIIKELPFCPEGGSYYIEVESSAGDQSPVIKVRCTVHSD